jgi:hypothetical protein
VVSSFSTTPDSMSERIDSSMKKGFPPARATIRSRSSSGMGTVVSTMRAASSSDSGCSTSCEKFARETRMSGDPAPSRCARRNSSGIPLARAVTNCRRSSEAESA